MSLAPLFDFMARGGPALWVIAALSVLTLALFLWRAVALAQGGAWRKTQTEAWIAEWHEGGTPPAAPGQTPLDRFAGAAMRALLAPGFSTEAAERETTRVAKAELAELRRGLRPLELIAAIAPLIGLLGTVLGMIGAFQALQESGSGADPSVLAGGIWEALLTTAAGMAVAIPASALASWIEGLAEREQTRMEDAATRVFNGASARPALRHAAE
ncbi:MotA/TolQ/ExbB proton channel family protein [Leisingera sp. ANG-Vp]|uniref:MotA/TolQ/ExbB proton channel family protein n=1 Tax=Leisingera sp. ANG-Vp TaxID=1577896 RepID=UPI000689B260|nr:MotA/TolQ/ExbB proton channel family protein [Leisingera sp. ANG-Vp]